MADNINCSMDWQQKQINGDLIPYDADIVGPGVLGAFIATALTALLALVFGLATYSLPLDLTNNVDDLVRDFLRLVFLRARTRLRILPLGLTEKEDFHSDRAKVLESFMIAVSDQILVSEIAVLVAAFSRFSSLSIYSANMVKSLALLASSVHLSTLSVIKRYIRSNRVVAYSKLALMLVSCGLLIVLLVFQASATWDDNAYFQCGVRNLEGPANALTGITYYFVPLLVILAHLEAIIRFVLPSDDARSPQPGPPSQTTSRRSSSDRNPASSLNADARRPSKSILRRDFYRHQAQAQYRQKRVNRPGLYYCMIWAFEECSDSYTFRIFWLASSCAYGITDVFQLRSQAHGMEGDPNEWGFGQIVPVVLLLLPILTATQNPLDYRGGVKRGRARQSGPSSKLSHAPQASAHDSTSEDLVPASSANVGDKSIRLMRQISGMRDQASCDPIRLRRLSNDSQATGASRALQDDPPRSPSASSSSDHHPDPPTEPLPTATAMSSSHATSCSVQNICYLDKWSTSNATPPNKNYPHRVDAIMWPPVRRSVYCYTVFMALFTLAYGILLTGVARFIGFIASIPLIVVSVIISALKWWRNSRLKKFARQRASLTDF